MMLNQLAQACKAYELDWGSYPSGDGGGTRSLTLKLRTLGARKLPYFEFAPDQLDPNANIRNPLEEGKIIYYRSPGIRNPKTFDLWCEDLAGRPDGINNWQKAGLR
jgi:hypothetical protein